MVIIMLRQKKCTITYLWWFTAIYTKISAYRHTKKSFSCVYKYRNRWLICISYGRPHLCSFLAHFEEKQKKHFLSTNTESSWQRRQSSSSCWKSIDHMLLQPFHMFGARGIFHSKFKSPAYRWYWYTEYTKYTECVSFQIHSWVRKRNILGFHKTNIALVVVAAQNFNPICSSGMWWWE